MVIDDVENNRQAQLVRPGDERAQFVRRPINASRRVNINAVVSPAKTRRLCYRHDFHRRCAQVFDIFQLFRRRSPVGNVSRFLPYKCGRMEFVDNQIFVLNAMPRCGNEVSRRRRSQTGRTVNPQRLRCAARVGILFPVRQTKHVQPIFPDFRLSHKPVFIRGSHRNDFRRPPCSVRLR